MRYIKQNKTTVSKHFILFLFLLSGELFSTEKYISGDTVLFSSEKVGLITLTQNIDSIKYYSAQNKILFPCSPTLEMYSAGISTYDTAFLIINVKDAYQDYITTFIWKSVPPGAYKFDWWQYIDNLPSGVYFIEKIINSNSEIYKAIFAK